MRGEEKNPEEMLEDLKERHKNLNDEKTRAETLLQENKKSFKLSRVPGLPVSDEELLADLQRIANLNIGNTLSGKKYKELGGIYDTKIYHCRFGSWNKALSKLGILPGNVTDISDQHLFENILILWQFYGRQPRKRELASPPSTISESPYIRRFGSWRKASEKFVDYANSSNLECNEEGFAQNTKKRTGRDPSLSLRWKVLKRDRFTCCNCGKSPASNPGVELHIDHIIPWSKGGNTEIKNLQTLCADCNLGKGASNQSKNLLDISKDINSNIKKISDESKKILKGISDSLDKRIEKNKISSKMTRINLLKEYLKKWFSKGTSKTISNSAPEQ